MRLTAFSVGKYRSIIRAHQLPLAASTILIGKNNEGKSNLLTGLATALEVVQELGRVRMVRGRLHGLARARLYDWDRDFPVQLQGSEPNGESSFRLEFQLDDGEREEFRRKVGSNLNEALPVEITIGAGAPLFRVIKRGPGSKLLNSKREKIASFIGNRVEFTYIPAVRTVEEALGVVRGMLDRELAALQNEEDYRTAVEAVARLQEPVLERLSQTIGSALREFLPSVESVEVRVEEDARYRALRRSVDVLVNDGTMTSLQHKGDGVQSLAAIGLLRGSASGGRHRILALEEPESHLHPSAIHRLRSVIKEIAATSQVVLTTHCPVFVDRVDVGSNILVQDNRAKPAESIEAIREALGVRASDNLRHAKVVLVVEGQTDRDILRAVLSTRSPRIAQAMDQHTLIIDPLGGSSKLSYKLSELRNAICDFHCFLDDDEAGRRAVQSALDEGLIDDGGFHLAGVGGSDSELEDLVVQSLYRAQLEEEFDVRLVGGRWRRRGMWSRRLEAVFRAAGKQWNEGIEARAKGLVARAVVAEPIDAVEPGRSGPIEALVLSLEIQLDDQH